MVEQTYIVLMFGIILIVGFFIITGKTNSSTLSIIPENLETYFGTPIITTTLTDEKFSKSEVLGGTVSISCPICIPEDVLYIGTYTPQKVTLDGIDIASCQVITCESLKPDAKPSQTPGQMSPDILALSQQTETTNTFFRLNPGQLKTTTITGSVSYLDEEKTQPDITFYQEVECVTDTHCIDRIRLRQLSCYDKLNICVHPDILNQLESTTDKNKQQEIINNQPSENITGGSNGMLLGIGLALIAGAGAIAYFKK